MNQVFKVGKRTYKIAEFESEEAVKAKYPNTHRRGVVAMYTLIFGKSLYTVNEFKGGRFSKPLLTGKLPD